MEFQFKVLMELGKVRISIMFFYSCPHWGHFPLLTVSEVQETEMDGIDGSL